MKILLITPDFPPVLNSAARLMGELAEDLSIAGNSVSVLCTMPGRYLSSDSKAAIKSVEDGKIRILRLRGPSLPKHSILARIIEQLFLPFVFVFKGALLPRFDAIFVYSPPVTLAFAALFLGLIKSSPVLVNMQDLYPQTVIDLGILRNRALIQFSCWLEKLLYRYGDGFVVHSKGNADFIVSRGADPNLVHMIPNWVDLGLNQCNQELGRNWRKEHGMNGKFLISFAGTMGFAQGLEDIFVAAQRLSDIPEVAFVFAGDGVFRRKFEETVRENRLTNVSFLPHQPPEGYRAILQASDVCLVNLHRDLATPVVPAKLQTIMAAGRPVLYYANPATAGRQIVERAGCGLAVSAGNIEGLVSAIRQLLREKDGLNRLGASGRRYAEQWFDRTKCMRAINEIIAYAARGSAQSYADDAQPRPIIAHNVVADADQ